MERVMGIEPTQLAWKAKVLPLNYTRKDGGFVIWWRGEDSNLRRQSRQIYSLIPLATREPLQNERSSIRIECASVNRFLRIGSTGPVRTLALLL